jgi:TolB-like protein/DNA-binding winged helix-turn-helix (wHTH) protein/predicted Zn-dependent protease
MSEVCHFEGFELDSHAYRLSCNGEVVRLERIPLELLCLLIERRDQIVTRREILERIWGKGVFIDSENAINTAVRKIRRALKDDANEPRLIVTIPGKGYRFVAPILVGNGEPKPVLGPSGGLPTNGKSERAINGKPADFPQTSVASRESQPPWRKYRLALLFSVVGIAGLIIAVSHLSRRQPQPSASKTSSELQPPELPNKPSIAVLPFINLGGDSEQEYFSDGITDDLIADLSRLPGLLVIDRGSTFTYKGKAAKVRDVGREVGVRYVLEGSVRKAAGQVRITVHLADTTTGVELWAERYNRPLRDVFAVQDEIVRRIVTTLNLQITLSQRGLVIPRSTENLEAYDYLLRGSEHLFSYTKEGNAKARPMFEKALELDPNYAHAYALLGLTYFFDWNWAFDSNPDVPERALRTAQQAIALDDSTAYAHSVLAHIYMYNGRDLHDSVHKWQNGQALNEARRGIALDPSSAFGYSALAAVLMAQGKPAEALAAVEKAIRLNPLNSVHYVWQEGRAYSHLGRWEESIRALKASLALRPDFLWAHAYLAIDYFNLRDHDGVRAETAQVEQALTFNPSAVGYLALALVLTVQGRAAEALVAAEKGMRFDPQNPFIPFAQGWAYDQLGRWQQGLSVRKRYLVLYPDDEVGARTWSACEYSALSEMDAARGEAAKVERAVARDPNSPYGYRALAMVMNCTGRPAQALAAAENAIRLYPPSDPFPPYPLCEQGRAYTQLGRWEEAVRALNGCLARYPDQVLPHVALAVDHVKLGQDDVARAEVAEILRLNPQFSLKMALESEFPAQRERTADLSKAGLK